MRHPFWRFLGVLAVVLAAALPDARADKPPTKGKPDEKKTEPHDPPPGPHADHAWGHFKVGSWVKTKSTTKSDVENASGGGIPTTEVVSEMKYTLKEIREDSYVLDMDITNFGNTQSMPMEYKFDPLGPGVEPPKVLQEKDEELKAACETWKCHYTKTEGAGMQGPETIETWKCDEAPGGVVKKITSSDMAGQKVTTVMTLDKKEDKIDVGGKKLKCWVLKMSTDAPPNNSSSSTIWFSHDVPGFMVKCDSTSKDSASKTESHMEVTGFEAKD